MRTYSLLEAMADQWARVNPVKSRTGFAIDATQEEKGKGVSRQATKGPRMNGACLAVALMNKKWI